MKPPGPSRKKEKGEWGKLLYHRKYGTSEGILYPFFSRGPKNWDESQKDQQEKGGSGLSGAGGRKKQMGGGGGKGTLRLRSPKVLRRKGVDKRMVPVKRGKKRKREEPETERQGKDCILGRCSPRETEPDFAPSTVEMAMPEDSLRSKRDRSFRSIKIPRGGRR